MDSKLTEAQVAAKLADIKGYMPNVYASIQAKAREIDREAYRLVRRGIKGESNCFYAFEAGRVIGTPFVREVLTREHTDNNEAWRDRVLYVTAPVKGGVASAMQVVAGYMVEFGCAHVCIWAAQQVEVTHAR